ncbi:SUMF1/EgtB/PvdO family nonheme iron enzyme [Hyphomicrobiales bacterium]|nr:SUMF1/EgtB/PvdO family nonheme iron enzyme [Hyphomicrobiales bacterium]CAH1697833.1 putative CASPASE_P20 domain-containing protein [Hyphomicrobiales bacterium]
MAIETLRRGMAPIIASLLILLIAATTAPAQTQLKAAQDDSPGRRVALVIGNSSYTAVTKLPNAERDAEAIANTLVAMGFTVVRGLNLTKQEMVQRLEAFRQQAATAEVALFYYAGHGIQIDQKNWMVSVNVRAGQRAEVLREAISLEDVVAAMSTASTKLIILDACRDNPFAGKLQKGTSAEEIEPGLARPNIVDRGVLVAYATSPGSVAFDGPAGTAHSPFTQALLTHLTTKGLEIRQMFTKVRQSVVEQTSSQQTPWENSSLLKDIYLAGRAPLTKVDEIELSYWRSIEAGRDPQKLIEFLDRFPRGTFAPMAERALEQLMREAAQSIKVVKDCPTCPSMAALPGGTYLSGSAETDAERAAGELPQTRAQIRPFAIGRYPVTFEQWDQCRQDGGCRANPSDGGFGRTSRPVINVTWNDAMEFVNWLRRKTGQAYRLPTEAEWEFAARSGISSERFWGRDPDRACRYANVLDLTAQRTVRLSLQSHGCADGFVFTSPAGSFEPNMYGLFDMLGNVWQWTSDCWDQPARTMSTSANASESCRFRALRGGSWMSDPRNVRITSRQRIDPEDSDLNIGFRVARDLPQ